MTEEQEEHHHHRALFAIILMMAAIFLIQCQAEEDARVLSTKPAAEQPKT